MSHGFRATGAHTLNTLFRYTNVLEIVGDIIKIKVPAQFSDQQNQGSNNSSEQFQQQTIKFGDLAILENDFGKTSTARVINMNRDEVSLQVFAGTKGVSTKSSVRFLGHPMQATYSENILGRIFDGAGRPIDNGPDLSSDPTVNINGPSVNPSERIVPKKMIRTDVPMIDLFNCLVESQKIPIFSVSGEPFYSFLARIGN
jgi:V/A-type H+-transporting ATPase subunit B